MRLSPLSPSREKLYPKLAIPSGGGGGVQKTGEFGFSFLNGRIPKFGGGFLRSQALFLAFIGVVFFIGGSSFTMVADMFFLLKVMPGSGCWSLGVLDLVLRLGRGLRDWMQPLLKDWKPGLGVVQWVVKWLFCLMSDWVAFGLWLLSLFREGDRFWIAVVRGVRILVVLWLLIGEEEGLNGLDQDPFAGFLADGSAAEDGELTDRITVASFSHGRLSRGNLVGPRLSMSFRPTRVYNLGFGPQVGWAYSLLWAWLNWVFMTQSMI